LGNLFSVRNIHGRRRKVSSYLAEWWLLDIAIVYR
jgi:hypothetical protein